MPDITAFAGTVAGVVALVAFIPYIIAIWRDKTKPSSATWWVWTVVGCMLGASYYSSGANHTVWVPVAYIIGPLAITAILLIKYGKGSWTRFDRYCLLGAGVGAVLWLALWWIFSSPLTALIIGLCIEFMGALPTIRKAYRESESENLTVWVWFFAASIVNVFAIESWTFAITVYPISMFVGSGLMTVSIFFIRRNRKAKTK